MSGIAMAGWAEDRPKLGLKSGPKLVLESERKFISIWNGIASEIATEIRPKFSIKIRTGTGQLQNYSTSEHIATPIKYI